MLVGAAAPLAVDGPRVTRMLHEFDFIKPVEWKEMAPLMDGARHNSSPLHLDETVLKPCAAAP